MRRNRFLSSLVLLLAGAISASSQVSNNNEDEVYKTVNKGHHFDFVPGEVLVKFKDGTTAQVNRTRGEIISAGFDAVDALFQEFGINEMEPVLPNEEKGRTLSKTRALNGDMISDHDLSQLYRLRMKEPELGKTIELTKRLSEQNEVEFAEPNYRAYIMGSETISENPAQNPSYPLQWGISAMKINELWSKPIVNEKRPVIAILDTGVDTTHPDLKDNITAGYDFVNETSEIRDYNAHGTHVAGIAAAVDNGEGIIGANPKALIMPVTVMQSDGTGDIATIIKGIDYAAANGATVINMSFGTYSNSRALRQALERAYQKAVIVAAAGNDAAPIMKGCDHLALIIGPVFPAAYSFVFGVMARKNNSIQVTKFDSRGFPLADFSNWDCDGPNFTLVKDRYGDEGCNYEMSAPGVGILSTVPNGGYKQFNGTSMAAPLVAGAISALRMVKDYATQEELWGDLLHTDDFIGAYNVSDRPAELDVIGIQFNDRKELGENDTDDNPMASGDGRVDAGEIISVYPVLRTVFGEASNIKLHLEVGENEDASIIMIKENDVDFGFNLSPYGKNVSLNPIVFQTKGNVVDGRHLKLKLTATCDNTDQIMEHIFTIVIDNLTKIGGVLTKDMILTPDRTYYVTQNLGIPEGIKLTIEPGTRIEFADGMGISSSGKIVANGIPGKPIVFARHKETDNWIGINSHKSTPGNPRDTISYCIIQEVGNYGGLKSLYHPYMKDCVIDGNGVFYELFVNLVGERNTITNCYSSPYIDYIEKELINSNIVNNDFFVKTKRMPCYSQFNNLNYFNNIGMIDNVPYYFGIYSTSPVVDHAENPSYLGTCREDMVRPYLFEVGNAPNTFGKVDLSNMPSCPFREAHGIVWKVVVNGKDSQDEFENLAPLGIGRHKFEVYYNRPMNKAVAPNISFGLREPYTQNAVNEDGAWNTDGTIYTAYITITKRTSSDGLNRIYVYGGEDNEFFECPYEKSRFNIIVQAVNSMSTGFMAEAGDHGVNLSWNKSGADGIEDAMGYNIYRYTETIRYENILDEFGNKIWDDEADDWKKEEIIERDTIRINPYVIDVEATSYIDKAVKSGETYYYYYKLQGTNLREYGMSNVVKVVAPENVESKNMITIGKSGKASYCGDKSLDFSFSEEVKAYIATGFDKDEGTIWLTRVKDVPAGVPVLIKGEANKTYDVPLTDSQNSYYTNMFVGNTSGETVQITETEGYFVNYYLSGDGTFKSVNKSANIGNNKCYLQLPGTFKPAVAGETQKVTIKDIGKASYAAPVDLDFTNVEGLKAFSATGYDKSSKTIWLTRVMKVQKGEGVLLKGDAKDYQIPSTSVQSSYMNMFVGNTSGVKKQVQETSEDGSQTNFYLNGDGSFVSVNGYVNISNNKCYLELPTSMVAVASTRGAEANYIWDEPEIIKLPISFRSIDNDGDGTTGINVQSSMQSDNAYYTLQGQRVEKPGKGLYIKNGKKVVIK